MKGVMNLAVGGVRCVFESPVLAAIYVSAVILVLVVTHGDED